MENGNAAYLSTGVTSPKVEKEKASSDQPPNLAAAAGTHVASRGDSDFAHAARQDSGRKNQDSSTW